MSITQDEQLALRLTRPAQPARPARPTQPIDAEPAPHRLAEGRPTRRRSTDGRPARQRLADSLPAGERRRTSPVRPATRPLAAPRPRAEKPVELAARGGAQFEDDERDGQNDGDDRQFSLPVVAVAAVLVIVGGFFAGVVLFPLLAQPKSLVPVIAGPAEITVSGSADSPGTGLPERALTGPAPVEANALVPSSASESDASGADTPGAPVATDAPLPVRFLQIGAFANEENVQRVTLDLLRLGVNVYLIPDGELIKVRVGPFETAEDQEAAAELLTAHGFPVVEREWAGSLPDAAEEPGAESGR